MNRRTSSAAALALLALAGVAATSIAGPTPSSPAPAKSAGSQPGDGEITRNLYDFRELRAQVQHPTSDAMDEVVAVMLGQYLGMGYAEVMDGVYIVEGDAQMLAQADEMFEGFRATLGRSYVVRVECWSVASGSEVVLGRPVPDGGERREWYEGIVAARRDTSVETLTEFTYINEWQPVVSDNAVGYDPEVSTASSGLSAVILIGEQEGDMIRARITGTLTDVTIDEQTVQLGDAQIPFTSPTIARRSLLADASIPLGEDVVVQALPGIEPETTLAVVVRVLPTDSVFVRRAAPPARPARP